MRTIPAYAVALILISVLFNSLGTADFFRYLTYTQNLTAQSNNTDYYSIAWSLSVEEWFYIVFPIAMITTLRVCKRRDVGAVLLATIAFIAIVTVVRFLFGPLDDWGPSVRRVVAFRIDSIAYGFLLYLILHRYACDFIAKVSVLQALAMLVLSAGLAMWVIELVARGGSDWPKNLFPFLAAAFGSACIVAAICASRWLERRPRMRKFGLFAGQISYSVYLFHLVFLTVLSPIIDTWSLPAQLLAYTAAIVGFTSIFYRTFERPILMARPDFAPVALKPAF
jgi:peptidoglycan/LPS O-acetylase OafA/YrhL